MKNTKLLTILGFIFCFSLQAVAQQRFELTIHLERNLEGNEFEVWLDDISGDRKLKLDQLDSTTIKIADTFYSAYAVVRLKSVRPSGRQLISEALFIGTEPADVHLMKSTDSLHPFQNLRIMNAWDFDSEKRDMNKFVSVEKKRALEFEAANSENLASGDQRTWKIYNSVMDSLRRKQLDYIAQHPDSYWSFYIFRAYLYKYATQSPESFLSVFKKFPDSFRFTNEGSTINMYFNGLQQSMIVGMAPDFKTTDVLGNRISLSAFRGKKYVLLHFWATWCVPCMEELPSLKQLHDSYRNRGLQIISVAYKSAKETDYTSTLVKYGMDWVNVYRDRDLLNAYGMPPTPYFILVDHSGSIIFNSKNISDNDGRMKALSDMINKLCNASNTIPQ